MMQGNNTWLIKQAKIPPRMIRNLLPDSRIKQWDFFDLYAQLGTSRRGEDDVAAIVGASIFSECVKADIAIPAAMKLVPQIINDALVYLASNPSNWHVQGEAVDTERFKEFLTAGTANDQYLRAQDLLGIVNRSSGRFLIRQSDGRVMTAKLPSEVFHQANSATSIVVDGHGIANKLKPSIPGALFLAVPKPPASSAGVARDGVKRLAV